MDKNGVASYAGIGISEDGTIMSWITDEGTDRYIKFSAERASELGFPEYDPEMWIESESASDNTESGSPEDTGADTSEEGSETEDGGSEE